MIKNKYNLLYYKIIDNAKSRKIFNDYTEKHHIIPLSMNGSNSTENLVIVTAREHFLLHYLLTKFTVGKDFHKMVKAFNMMGCFSNRQKRYVNSRLYESNKKHLSKTMSNLQIGENNSQFGKIWVTDADNNISKKILKTDMNQVLKEGWVLGRKNTKFQEKMKMISLCQPVTDKTLVIYKDGETIKTKESIFHRDYLLEGWKILQPGNRKGLRHIKSLKNKNNMSLPPDIAKNFIASGLWEYGTHVPNHKGTKGKTYKFIEGKKVFD